MVTPVSVKNEILTPCVHISFIEISGSENDNKTFTKLALSLPRPLQAKIGRKKLMKHRVMRAAGWLLLQHQLIQDGYDANLLVEVQTTDFGEPFIAGAYNFSLSYSGKIAVCAVADVDRLGVDVEVVRDIEIAEFSRYFSDSEWSIITRSKNPEKAFFRYWTKKESVLKADGRGLSVDPIDVTVTETDGYIKDSYIKYYLYSIPCISDIVAANLCTNQSNISLDIKQIEVTHLASTASISLLDGK